MTEILGQFEWASKQIFKGSTPIFLYTFYQSDGTTKLDLSDGYSIVARGRESESSEEILWDSSDEDDGMAIVDQTNGSDFENGAVAVAFSEEVSNRLTPCSVFDIRAYKEGRVIIGGRTRLTAYDAVSRENPEEPES